MPRKNSPHPGVPTLDAGEKKFNSHLVAPTGFSKGALRRVRRRALSLTGAKFTTRNLCSTRTGRWSDIQRESTELFLLLDHTWFKSRRPLGFWKVVLPRKICWANSPHVVETSVSSGVVWPMPA